MIRELALAVAVVTTLAGCAPRAEEPILGEFFHTARLRDRTALQKIATVPFDPAAQGIITDFTITDVVVRHSGGQAVKEVTISAPVTRLTGEVVKKNLVVTLERLDGRWIVTAIRDAAPSGPSSPPS
jgi:hypothetical protein